MPGSEPFLIKVKTRPVLPVEGLFISVIARPALFAGRSNLPTQFEDSFGL